MVVDEMKHGGRGRNIGEREKESPGGDDRGRKSAIQQSERSEERT